MIKYRVILKIGYNEGWFEFDNAAEAISFATVALQSMVANEDSNKKTKITMEIINTDGEEEED